MVGKVAIPGGGGDDSDGEGGWVALHFVRAITGLGGERFNDVITIISD